MSYATAQARQELLDELAAAVDEIGVALAALGEAYEDLDEHAADRLEEQMFRPAQSAYGRARRTHAEFAARVSLPPRDFAEQRAGLRPNDPRAAIQVAWDAAAQADQMIADLQDSMRPVEVGDRELRTGLSEVRQALAGLPEAARQLLGTLGR